MARNSDPADTVVPGYNKKKNPSTVAMPRGFMPGQRIKERFQLPRLTLPHSRLIDPVFAGQVKR